jgi:hypothetical protein
VSKELRRSFVPRIVAGSHQCDQLAVPQYLQEWRSSIPYGVWPGSSHDEHWNGDRLEVLEPGTVSKAGIESSSGSGTTLTEPRSKSAIQVHRVTQACD